MSILHFYDNVFFESASAKDYTELSMLFYLSPDMFSLSNNKSNIREISLH